MNTTSLSERIAKTLQPETPDAWVALFGSAIPSRSLLELMAHGQVPLDPSPERPTALLDAFLAPRATGHALPYSPAAHAFPPTPEGTWPTKYLGQGRTNCYDANVVGRLLAAGACPTWKAEKGRLPTWAVAAAQGWSAVVLQLLARPDAPSGDVLARQPSPHKPYTTRQALLWPHAWAMEGRTAELSAWLGLPGADPNLRDAAGRTPLFLCTAAPAVQLLLEHGADPKLRALDGRTAAGTWSNSLPGVHLANPADLLAALEHHHPGATQDPSVVLNQWLSKGPPPLSTVPEGTLKSLEESTVRTQSKTGEATWGPLGYLASRLRGFYHKDPAVSAWVRFMDEVPAAWKGHESVPGVSDAWLFLVALTGVLKHDSGNRVLFKEALTRWGRDVLADVPADRQAACVAANVLTAVETVQKHRKENWPGVFWVAELSQEPIRGTSGWWQHAVPDASAKVTADDRAGALQQGIASKVLRPLLLSEASLVEAAAAIWPGQTWDPPSLKAVWVGLCQGYVEKLGSAGEAREVMGSTALVLQALEKVVLNMVKAGHPPPQPLPLGARKGFAALTKAFSPDVAALVKATLLGHCVHAAAPNVPPAPRRPRM